MMGDTGRIGTCWGPVGAVPNLVSSLRPQADRKQGLSLRSRYLAGKSTPQTVARHKQGFLPQALAKLTPPKVANKENTKYANPRMKWIWRSTQVQLEILIDLEA